MKRELGNLEAKTDFLKGLQSASQAILSDPEPHEDSFEDAWYEGRSDEESKLNLNFASEPFLRNFLKLFEEKVDSLKGERKDFVKQILKARQKGKIPSLEELYLLEDIEKEDIEKLRPYLTVYPEVSQMNINTLHPLILKALIESLPGDSFAKDELYRKLAEARLFVSDDLIPNRLAEKLKLTPNLSMLMLVNALLPHLTTDSRTFRLVLASSTGKKAEAVVREAEDFTGLEVLYWHEG